MHDDTTTTDQRIDHGASGHAARRDAGSDFRHAGGDGPLGSPAPARCADGDATFSYLFFSDDEIHIARAKAICARCGRRELCLASAIERREPWGVWGGEVFVDGQVVAVKRRRGRPPKHPRPPIVVDEVPIPPLRATWHVA
jgi:WhiB family redox-sensing transcriptional regulator